jgi:hypothetical protein
LAWRFPANVIAMAFKFSERRVFYLRQLFAQLFALNNAVINHGELEANTKSQPETLLNYL